MHKSIEGARNFELKRNLAIPFAQEECVEESSIIEVQRFTVQQYSGEAALAKGDEINKKLHNEHNKLVSQPTKPDAAFTTEAKTGLSLVTI